MDNFGIDSLLNSYTRGFREGQVNGARLALEYLREWFPNTVDDEVITDVMGQLTIHQSNA